MINRFYLKKRLSMGATLVEVMVSTVVFAVISLVLMVILNIGVKSWRDVSVKSEAELSLIQAAADINATLLNCDMDSVSAAFTASSGADSNGYGYLSCSVSATYDDTYGFMEKHMNYESLSEKLHFYYKVIYFVASKSSCEDCESLFNGYNPDLCPHKLLAKKWYRINESVLLPSNMEIWDSDKASSYNELRPYAESSPAGEFASYNKILSRNVMTFKANVDSNNDAVSYSIKVFNPNVNKIKIDTSAIRQSFNVFYLNNEDRYEKNEHGFYTKPKTKDKEDPLADYTFQVDGLITPLNAYSSSSVADDSDVSEENTSSSSI